MPDSPLQNKKNCIKNFLTTSGQMYQICSEMTCRLTFLCSFGTW